MVVDIDLWFSAEQYSLAQPQKEPRLLADLNRLTAHHRTHCDAYRRVLDAVYAGGTTACALAEVPLLPVSLFKHHILASVPEAEVFKTLQSSGTTGQQPSRIVLDAATARLQTRALAKIMSAYLGSTRLPMLIVDHPAVISDRRTFSARGAGILGMMPFGRDYLYVLNEEMRLDLAGLRGWLARHEHQQILVFGFTFMVWQYFVKELAQHGIDLARGVLVHSGGWKRLQDEAVDNATFKARVYAATGIRRVHNFYGMVEQVGSVFVECPAGYFHAPNFADVLMRDPRTWQPVDVGQPGVVEVFSLLPLSYPGHALLTEDLGVVHGIDTCPCGRRGRYFSIAGRVPKAELRGCSDTHAYSAAHV
jgi:hypothetical protein